MAGTGGQAILVQIESAVPGTYTTIGGQRGATISEESAEIDLSSKDAREWTGTYGRYSSTVSCEHLYVSPLPTEAAIILTAVRAGVTVKLKRMETPTAGGAAVSKGIATAIVTSWELDAPDQAEAICSAEFKVTGAWSAS